MTKKYYVVLKGRRPGIYDNWKDTDKQVSGYSGSIFKSIKTLKKAEQAYSDAFGDLIPLYKKANVEIFCDGSHKKGNTGSGVVIYRKGKLEACWYGMHESNGTSNSAELNGLLRHHFYP